MFCLTRTVLVELAISRLKLRQSHGRSEQQLPQGLSYSPIAASTTVPIHLSTICQSPPNIPLVHRRHLCSSSRSVQAGEAEIPQARRRLDPQPVLGCGSRPGHPSRRGIGAEHATRPCTEPSWQRRGSVRSRGTPRIKPGCVTCAAVFAAAGTCYSLWGSMARPLIGEGMLGPPEKGTYP